MDAALHHYDTLHVNDIGHTSPADAHHVVRFSALGREFHLILEWDRNLLTKDFRVRSVDGQGRHYLHKKRINSHSLQSKCKTSLCEHSHLGMENDSIIAAHLSDDKILSAVIATPTDIYHLEPSQYYLSQPHPLHMVAYAQSHVKQRLNSTLFDYATPPVFQAGFSKHQPHGGERVQPLQRLRRQTLNTGNVGGSSCNMVLIADNSAYRLFRNSVSGTSSQLVSV